MIISPYERARRVYQLEPCARTFTQDLVLHLANGYVYSDPDAFIMGRPVDRFADPAEIVNPEVVFKEANAWLVYLAAGHLQDLYRFLPYHLDYVGWERDNKLRFYPFDQIHEIICSL